MKVQVTPYEPEYFDADGNTLYQVGDAEFLQDCPDCAGDGISTNEADFEFEGFTGVCRVKCRTCEGEGAIPA